MGDVLREPGARIIHQSKSRLDVETVVLAFECAVTDQIGPDDQKQPKQQCDGDSFPRRTGVSDNSRWLGLIQLLGNRSVHGVSDQGSRVAAKAARKNRSPR